VGGSGASAEEAKAIYTEEVAQLDAKKRRLQRQRHFAAKEGRETGLIDRLISSIHRRKNALERLLREVRNESDFQI
jgi:hypothetical protein